ncbi:MAG: hypothetical protein H7840_05800 [Alphaproteobacteria bacterium]
MQGRDSGEGVAGLLRQRPVSEADWTALIRPLLDDGQYFLAYDAVRQSLEHHPDSLTLTLIGALALVRSGAVAEARRLLAPIDRRLETMETRLARAFEPLQALVRRIAAASSPASDAPDAASLTALTDLAIGLDEIATRSTHRIDDPGDLRLIAEIYRTSWQHLGAGADLHRARDAAAEAYRLTGAPGDGIVLATVAFLAGNIDLAVTTARAVTAALETRVEAGKGDFADLAGLGLARLLCGDGDGATAAFVTAATLAGGRYPLIIESLHDVRLLQAHGVAVPQGIFDQLPPPCLVVFAGSPIDAPGLFEPVFPPHLEHAVRRAIDQRLEAIGADIGFCSAACGSDILFIEAMLDRGGEVHLFLPFGLEDFIAARVAYAGPGWVRRFRKALKLASSVTHTTDEGYLGHDALFRFNNQVIMGMARLRAGFLLTEPHLVVAWSYLTPAEAGSTSDFIDHWPDISRLQMIDLDELAEAGGPLPVSPSPVTPPTAVPGAEEEQRTIRTMLFADMVGFSKLREQDLPRLWRFMKVVAERMARAGHADASDTFIEAWGDALYVNKGSALDLADYAFALLDAMAGVDWAAFALPQQLQFRTALHAGPAYSGHHPLTGRPLIYGSHVSRAARLEPVTVPGHVYASQQFVALLVAEESAARHEALALKRPYADRYQADYLGILSLAKNYGQQPVYHLRKIVSLREPYQSSSSFTPSPP